MHIYIYIYIQGDIIKRHVQFVIRHFIHSREQKKKEKENCIGYITTLGKLLGKTVERKMFLLRSEKIFMYIFIVRTYLS